MAAISKDQVEFDGDESSVEHDPRWELAQRAASSPVLSRATQLRAILLYIVRQVILRPEESVHEFEIAHRVLGRRSDFNPLDDSIVRVQMAQLRKRLDLYFSNEGKDEEVVINIALGSYEPIFSNRSKRALSSKPAPATEVAREESAIGAKDGMPSAPPSSANSKGTRGGTARILWTTAACLAALILGAIGGFYFRSSESRDQQVKISNPILHLIFAPDAVVNVVIADTSLVFLQNTVHSDISVGDYLDPRYPSNILANTTDPVLRSTLTELATGSRYTSLNDADVVGQCFRWGSNLGAKIDVRYARYMHVRDFEQGNFVIVGSRRGNPWTTLFEPSLNFVFEEDPANHTFHFRNRHPKPGESPTYSLSVDKDGDSVGYIDIAILPNLAGTGSVLMLNGFSIETNEAAANLIFEKDIPSTLSHALPSLSDSSKVEILLRVRNLDKADLGWEIVSIRANAS